MANFNDLLSRADNLKSRIAPADSQSLSTSKRSGEHDLRSIFRASDEIWKRKQLRSDLQWKPTSAVAGVFPASTTSAISTEPKQAHTIEPLDQSTSVAFDSYIKRSAERAKLEAERLFINQYIMEKAQSVQQKLKSTDANNTVPGSTTTALSCAETKPDDFATEVFAKNISKVKNSTTSIEPAVRETLKEINAVDANKLWRKVFALCERKRTSDSGSVADYRNSDQWKSFVIDQAINLLQQTFKDHMEAVIQNNLQQAQRGGHIGTMSLIEAYLNLRLNPNFEYQDGNYGRHPIWPFMFLCLRVGDFAFASKVAMNLKGVIDCSILVNILINFNTNQSVDGNNRFQLNAEWKHIASTCRDPYRRAVYGMILGHECPEVNNSIENWLWSRLMNCRLDPVNGLGHFYKLQTTICVDHGEEYFIGGSGNYTLYFTALWLTGQLERAVDLLFRTEQRCHAVHIAILAFQQGLLNINSHAAAPILSSNPKDQIYCQFNFSRAILLYVKNFEATNLEYTLSYCFFLRNLEFEQSGGLEGGNIFEACVSRLCFITEKVDLILGRMSETGNRIPGLIDKFSAELDVHKIIARVANDLDISGDSLTGCRLYILSGHPNEALQICSKQLAAYLTTVHSKSDESSKELEDTITLGKWLEDRYKHRPESGLKEAYLAELSTLLKLSSFYAAVERNPNEAFSIMTKLNLLPLTNEELPSRVANFANLPEQVRIVLPDVLLLFMETLVNLFNDQSSTNSKRVQCRMCSNALLVYAAQINLRLPIHINSKLLQLQCKLN